MKTRQLAQTPPAPDWRGGLRGSAPVRSSACSQPADMTQTPRMIDQSGAGCVGIFPRRTNRTTRDRCGLVIDQSDAGSMDILPRRTNQTVALLLLFPLHKVRRMCALKRLSSSFL
eukprot:6041876-Pyramimonas_sp.AAC.1